MSGFPVMVNADGSSHPTGSKGRFGATIHPPATLSAVYPDNVPLSPRNAAAFEAIVGFPCASVAQKVYLAEGQMPKTVDPSWVTATEAGGFLTVCAMPPKTMSDQDATNFEVFVAALDSELPVGSWQFVNWQEPNTNKHFGVAGAAAYKAVCKFYGDIFRKACPGVPLVYDPCLAAPTDDATPQSCVDFYPGRAYADKMLLDYYGASEVRGSGLAALQQVAAVADQDQIPLGIGETNAAASAFQVSRDQWDRFGDLLIGFFYGRLEAGKDNAEIMFWMGIQSNAQDLIATASDWKVATLQRLHSWLA